jgi:hypothetical protein
LRRRRHPAASVVAPRDEIAKERVRTHRLLLLAEVHAPYPILPKPNRVLHAGPLLHAAARILFDDREAVALADDPLPVAVVPGEDEEAPVALRPDVLVGDQR